MWTMTSREYLRDHSRRKMTPPTANWAAQPLSNILEKIMNRAEASYLQMSHLGLKHIHDQSPMLLWNTRLKIAAILR